MLALTDTLHQLIEAQAERTPDQIAVVFEDQRLSYRELDRRADLLAHRLRALGAGPDVRIGLFVERSLDMIVGILGILKAGSAYVPVDAVYPSSRIEFMLSDAEITILLTQTGLRDRLPEGVGGGGTNILSLDEFDWSSPAPGRVNAPCGAANLAYVIYTSGTTGRPKGVAVEHRNIVDYVLGVAQRLRFEPGMKHATVSTIAADLGNTVIFPALATGGTLHVVSRERAENQSLLADYCDREQIDVLKIVPSHLAALQVGQHPERVMPRRRLILGGEASRLDWIERLRALSPECEIYNHYGPTETTVGALTYQVGPDLPITPSGTLPIGMPLPGAAVHILDADRRPVPAGAQGELYIGGRGVARGYLNQLDLTAEKFLPDPFSPEPGARLYRTGDVARQLPDGTIEFCGRSDDQIKLRGYRVEPGEIEAALRDHRGVRDAVVRAFDDAAGGKQLVAYVVPSRANQALWGSDQAVYVLPDGSSVAHLNKNETDYIYNEVFVLQAYLRHGITIRDGDCIVDAGANIGLFTVFASRLARDLRILAFEPNPAAFACLQANAAAWGRDSGVTCLPVGLSHERGSAELTCFEGLSLLSGFYADAAVEREMVKNYVQNQEGGEAPDQQVAAAIGEVIEDRLRTRTVSAQLRTLSDVIADEGIERIDLLKVNVEKSELNVLRGIGDGDWPKIRQLVIEVDLQQNREPITTLLEQRGFTVVVEQDPLLRNTELCYVYAAREPARQQEPGASARVQLSEDGEVLTPARLREHLKARLPQYMIPSAFMLLEQLPLTSNGKVDRQALPAPSAQETPGPAAAAVRPLTETEKTLTAIWSELLKVDSVGLHDDFFDLGGHSLLAIKATSRIRELFDVDLQTRTLFEHPTIAALSEALGHAKRAGSDGKLQRIAPRPAAAGDACALSFVQEQIWFLDQLAPGSPAYNMVDVVTVRGTYDPAAMQQAVNELVRRHAVLRTAFAQRDGQLHQVILPTVDLTLADVDLSARSAADRDQTWMECVHRQGRAVFDLAQAPLLRATMVHWSQDEHRLLLTIHHIIADEWSMEVIHQEIAALYGAFSKHRPSPLAELPIQYADFACWQRDWLQGEVLEKETAYWNEQLAGAAPALDLLTDKPRPAVQSFRGAVEGFALPGGGGAGAALLERLTALGREEQATLFMTLEAAFAALLHRYTGQDDILVGTPISGRSQRETEGLIGCFLNTVVLRSRFTEQLTFRALLRQVRERALGAYAHPDLPFDQLVAAVAREPDPSRTPLCNVMFVLHDPGGVSQLSKVSGHRRLETGTAKFDLTLFISQTDDGGLEGLVEYSTDLFEAGTIQRLCGHFGTLLEEIVNDPDQRVTRLPLLTAAERQQVLVEWNDTAVAFADGDRAVHQLIEAQAGRTPEQIAVVFGQQQLTYGELDRRAVRLADQLRRLDVRPGVRVGVCVERSPEMVVALLGILKAGGAYVPLDPSFPPNRLGAMVTDSQMTVLVTHDVLDHRLPVRPPGVVRLDGDWETSAAADGDLPARSAVTPADIAYVLYTSGSTGEPKGVEIPHSALVNFLLSMQQAPGFTAGDTLLAVTTLSFDIAALELFLPLVTGGRVVIASREDAVDPLRLIERVRESGCTVMQATPATWRALVDAQWSGSPTLKILCGGEALPPDLARVLLPHCAELWNMYGPTETTVWSTVQRITEVAGPAPIGRPIANTQVFVLDAQRHLVPPGLAGELYIGGKGVARGYLRREALTRERFVASPFDPQARLYRTGDVARWLPDGRLEWLGRSDHQMKVRGFRIEAGEIEAIIARHAAVRAVVVIAREDVPGDKRLVAYVVVERPPSDLVEQLRALVRSAAPEYMVPADFVTLPALPRTANGKLDRKALPAPPRDAATPLAGAVAPRTPTEETVMRLFRAVLERADFGVLDSFFDLGGHSLMAARLVSQLRAATGIAVPLRNLFEHPTVAALARVVDALTWAAEGERGKEGAGEPVGEREEIAL